MNIRRVGFIALAAVFLCAGAVVAQTKRKQESPVFTDKEHGFEISKKLPKKMMRHWDFEKPGEGDGWFVKVNCDYGEPFFILVFGNPPDLSKDPRKYRYEPDKHAENREKQERESKSNKKVTQKKFEKRIKFGKDKNQAAHLVLDIVDENDIKYEKHFYCFKAGRNQWTYDVIVYVEPGLLDKKNDKKKVKAQLDAVLGSFRAFRPTKKR